MLNARRVKSKIFFAVSGGVTLQWLSLFFSYQKLPSAYQSIQEPIAKGGFPLKIFEYPPSPMGNDWPPIEMWLMFFLNMAIWVIIVFFVATLLESKFKNKIIPHLVYPSAVILSIVGLFYILIKFD